MKNNKDKILLFLKLPPPLTGATLMNSYAVESKLLQDNFQIKTIAISYKKKIADTGILSLRKIGIVLKLFIQLVKAILFFRPKFIYFQISPLGSAFYRDCIFAFVMKMLQQHIVLHLHGKGIAECVEKSKINKWIYKWAFKGTSVICLSESLTSDIAQIYDQPIYIVNNAIPVVLSTKEPIKKEDNSINILFLSNLIISKGIYIFLDAIEILNQNQAGKINVWIVGKEVEITENNLKIEIEKRGISLIVSYLGAQYGEAKNDIFRKTDILVYPSFNDVWGLVILEAMQFGIPVVASKEGAIPEIVDDGVTGFIVEKHNPQQIAEKVEQLINSSELRRKMGEAAKKKFEAEYILPKFEGNLLSVFKEIGSKL